MQLEVGVLVPSSGARADVLLRVDAGTPLGAVQDELLSRVAPGAAGAALHVGGRDLDGRAPLGRPPLVRGALLEVDAAPGPGPATLELHCIGGPDAGRRWPLPAGDAVLGREAPAAVRVDDPLVSRAHCTLHVDTHVDSTLGAVAVTDRGTTNGTSVDGSPVTTPRTALRPGAVLTVGRSRFALAGDDLDDAPTRPDGTGSVAFNRPPRRPTAPAPEPVDFPAAPSAAERRPLPVLAVLAPVVLGVVLWRVLGSATFLLFTLLSPVLVIGTAVTEHRWGRRQHRRAVERHRRATQEATERLRAAVQDDVRLRRARWPDPATTACTAAAPGARLWERRGRDSDVLAVSVGTADQPADVPVTGQPPAGGTTAAGVPVVVPLTEVGVLGVAGPDPAARAVARWVTVQAAVWHSPRELSIVVLASSGAAPHWAWTRWLPHLRPADGQPCRALLGVGSEQAAARVAELRSLLAQRRSAPRGEVDPRRVLLLVDGGPALRDLPGLAELLDAGPELGVHAVVVAADRRLLPESCGALAVLDDTGGATVELVAGRPSQVTSAVADGMSVRTAELVARSLAPLRDTSAEHGAAGLPRSVAWSDLVGLDLVGGEADVEAVALRWTAGAGTRALLGVAADGPFAVDLRADGPHALVAGTTGSGKSELLQTWIASLAVGNPPDELSLVLVDYKGGAAFGPCAGLPHVAGLVTDLDAALASRALASLAAELRRREALLATTGARDLDEHRRRAGPGEHVPRLVLMVDEFASLVDDLPDFVDGLVDIAQRGRSLGVHLVLATQRPGGVVSADIRANTNLRLCLAVARDTDSRDVLDVPAAAHLSRTTPGRGFVRTGHTELTAVQVARVSGPRRAPDTAPTVTLLPVEEAGDPPPEVGGATGASDLGLLVEACTAAAGRLGLPAPAPPWTPPLPDALALTDLPPYDDPLAGRAGRLTPLAYGLLDLPEAQRQCPLVLDLDTSTHLLVVGAPRTGRTTVVRSLAAALARAVGPDDAHLYVVDATGHGLADLAALPHTGAVVTRGETERLERVVGWLGDELARRQQVLAAGGFGSLAEQRASAEPAGRLPALVLLLDGFDAFLADHGDRDAGRLVDAVHALLREGPAAGLHAVLTAGRGALTGRLTALVDTRLVLRLAERGDDALAGVPDRLVGTATVPGRGRLLDAGGCASAQVALPAPVARAAPATAARLHPPHRVLPLPESVTTAALPPPRPLRAGEVVLGAGGDDGSAVVADLGAGFLVAGPPGSGRSTALRTVASQLAAAGMPVVAVAPRASPLRELPDCVRDGEDAGALELLLGRGPCAVLVDDAELLVQSPLGSVLERTVRFARDTGHLVVAAGTTDDLVLGYRGFVVDLRRSRRGVLLWPQSPADGDLLGVRLPRAAAPPRLPGRGLLCEHGAARPVQLAH